MQSFGAGKIVVTGGAGLIGSTLIWALNRRGIDDILVVDALDETDKWRHLVPLRFADYIDAADFLDALPDLDNEGIGTILHLGACSSTTERDSAYLMRNNYEYTKILAHWAVDNRMRFVYASSAATYGSLEAVLSEEMPLHDLRPLNAYGYSKHLFDLYAQRSGLAQQICGIKYFNVFGPNEDHKGTMRSMVHKAYEQIRDRGVVRLFKSDRPEFRDGEQRRDFIYVKDAAGMTLHLAQSGVCGIFNVGSGVAHTWLDLIRPIFRALDVPERIEFVEMPVELRDKYQYYTCADIERLRASGYDAPVTTLHEAVSDYVTNYLAPGRLLEPADPPVAMPHRATT